MYYIAIFYKNRGRYVEYDKRMNLDLALELARKEARTRYRITRVRDEENRVRAIFECEGFETPECYWEALNNFAEGK